MNYNVFDTEHAEWVQQLFPNQPHVLPAAGMFEECGEVVQAVVKLEQVKLWGEEQRHKGADWNAKLIDAIGDCIIYSHSLSVSYGRAWMWMWLRAMEGTRNTGVLYADVMRLCVELSRSALRIFDMVTLNNTPYEAEYCQYVTCLRRLCYAMHIDFDTTLTTTWDTVKQRKR